MPSKTKPQSVRPKPGYPNREDAPKPGCDADRRRFLRQLAAGTGAAVVGLPRLSHGQSLVANFDKLHAHPGLGDAHDAAMVDELAADAADSADSDDDAPADFDDAFAEMADAEAEPERSADPAPSADAQELTAEAEPWIDENRALWVEPGYLILLQWSRPSADESVIAALEGSASVMQELLGTWVSNVDQLHNIEQLHQLERDLIDMLAIRVHPAQISVLHLDHDCTVVCSALNPSRTYPEIYEVDGDMPAPGWE